MDSFKIGDQVKPRNRNSYGGDRRGIVVEVTKTRIRVAWDKQSNGVAAKRTWMTPGKLILVVTAEQPA